MIVAVSSLKSASWAPLTVTDWAVSHVPVPNAKVVVDTVTSPASPTATATATVTAAVGAVPNRTVKASSPPSATANNTGSTTRPGVSLSVTVTITEAVMASYPTSAEAAVTVTVGDSLPASLSSTPVTVTDCVVSQVSVVKVNAADGTVAAPGSSEEAVTITFAEGRVANLTVNEPVESSPNLNVAGATTRPGCSDVVALSLA